MNYLSSTISLIVEKISSAPNVEAIFILAVLTFFVIGLRYIYDYSNDIYLYKSIRYKIIVGILLLAFVNALLGAIIYIILAFMIYPFYQSISQAKEFKIIIFIIIVLAISDVLIVNRNINDISNDFDSLFSGFGLGNGLTWLNNKIINIISACKDFINFITFYLFERELEEQNLNLVSTLSSILDKYYPDIDIFIEKIKRKLNNSRYKSKPSYLNKLDSILSEYQNNRSALLDKLTTFTMGIYSKEMIEKWKNGESP